MEALLTATATNAIIAAILALTASIIARFTRRPTLWFVLWLVVLLRLLAPPLLGIAVPIPDFGPAAGHDALATVDVTGAVVALDDPGLTIEPITVLVAVWIAGAMVIIGFAIAQTVHLKQILGTANPVREQIAVRSRVLSRRLGLRRAPPTVEVDDRVPPMLWAFLGTVRLILPTALLDRLDEDRTDTLLAHELAHLARRDHWVRHLEIAALALFWWNPIAWWAALRLRRAQELCCDDRVASLLPDKRRAYADTLVETARFLSGRRLPLGSPARAMADLSQMKGRIQMIMSDRQRHRLALPIRLTAAAILVAAVAVTPILTADTDAPEFTGEPINLELRDADIHDVLATFSELTGTEILVEPGVSAKVTIVLEDVPWDKALDTILEKQGLEWEVHEGRIIIRAGDAPAPPAAPEPPAPASPPEAHASTSPPVGVTTETVRKYIEGGPISKPTVRERVAPKYPPEMREQGISGRIIARLVIDKDGFVQDVEIVESPAGAFSEAATEALEQWTFEPATLNGDPVAVSYIVTLMFRLE
jgi:TonB family protein